MAKKAAALVTGYEVLLAPEKFEPGAVCVVVGDDGFLQHEVRRALVAQLYDANTDGAPDYVDGETAELRDVLDALSELSLFGGDRRVVVVEDADDFVKEHRESLEDYVAAPRQNAVLILEVSTWPGNTRLAKAVAEKGLNIKCQPPEKGPEVATFARQLKEWLIAVARRDFDSELARPAVEQLIELLPAEPGILYQEIGRLALLAGESKKIDAALVRDNVGGWRTRKTWDMIDAVADGNAIEALKQADRLLAAGDEVFGLLPQMASTLRRFALAVRLIERAERQRQPMSLQQALERAGVPPFKLGDAERQLRQIGRQRAGQLYHWLLAADLEIKGYNSAKDRARRVLEMLIIRLSRQAQSVEP